MSLDSTLSEEPLKGEEKDEKDEEDPELLSDSGEALCLEFSSDLYTLFSISMLSLLSPLVLGFDALLLVVLLLLLLLFTVE